MVVWDTVEEHRNEVRIPPRMSQNQSILQNLSVRTD